jgi:hypothetical protein
MADGSRSSLPPNPQVTSHPAWRTWVMPSIADLIFLALLAMLVFTPLSVKVLNDAGIGWHIRTGQMILATHSIPRVDPFSTQIQKPWFAWEWLYDLAVGKLEAACGLNGVVWLTAVVIAAVFAWTFRLLIRRGTNLFVALALVLLAMSASTIHFLTRPHVLTWLFTLAWFWILDSTEPALFRRMDRHRRRLWLLPVLMLVWVNVHGGFLLGFVLLGIYWLGAVWTWFATKGNRIEEVLQKISAAGRAKELALIGVISAIASLINPYGWKLHAHIYSYLTNHFLMNHIDEFQSPNFHGVAQECFLALLLIAFAVVITRGRGMGLSRGLILLFAVYAGLSASRNIPIASILLVMVVGPLFVELDKRFSRRMTVVDSALRRHLWPIVAAVLTFVIAIHGGRVGSSQWMDAHFDPRRMPVDAVNFLRSQNARALELQDIRAAQIPQCGPYQPVLSPDYWGGYLIYRLYPNNKVVIDDRHDFYGEPFLRSYLTTIHVEPGWGEFLRNHSSCLLLPRKAALTQVLSETAAWKAVYSDDVAVVFVRTEQPEDSNRSLSQQSGCASGRFRR